MNDTNSDSPPGAGRDSRSGWAFSAGLLVGLVTAIGAMALAVAAERRRRQRDAADREADDAVKPTLAADSGSATARDWRIEDSELDEELAQTFPASDPLPSSHRID